MVSQMPSICYLLNGEVYKISLPTSHIDYQNLLTYFSRNVKSARRYLFMKLSVGLEQ
jgi:hypothetical protein